MYCPKCKCEYRDGFTYCSDCKTPLLENLPVTEETIEPDEFIEVRSSFRQDEISIIKSILEARKIKYLINCDASTMYPIPGKNSLMVQKDEYDNAVELLKDFL